jgi:hypothetical protein
MNIRHSHKLVEHRGLDILEVFHRKSAQQKSPILDFSPTIWASIITAAFFCFWIGESALSATSLITPINAGFSFATKTIGLVAGLILGISFARNDKAGMFKKALVVALAPFLVVMSFEGLAWRMANMWEFGLSTGAFQKATYPVKYANSKTRRRNSWYSNDTLEIDPFKTGVGTDIPVPSDQFKRIWQSADKYCVVVQQRRSANGAIQIRTDGKATLSSPAPVELTQCRNLMRPI